MGFGPIDYSDAFAGATPFQSLAQGYQLGAGIRDDQQKQVQLVQQQELQTQQLAAQQAQAQVIQRLVSNPNASAQDYANAALLVPGMKDQIKQGWDMRTAEQQAAHLSSAGQYFAAIQNGSPELAVGLMNRRADAMEASGADPNTVRDLRTNAQIIQAHPEFGKTLLGMMLASMPGGDKVIAGATGLSAEQRAQQEQPYKVQKIAGEASQEATKANVAAATAPADIRKAGATADEAGAKAYVAAGTANADIEAAGLKNENLRQDALTSQAQREIARLNVQIGQANSETQRGELVLKRDEWQQKLVQTQREQGKGAQDASDAITQSLSTVDRLLKHPGLEGFFYGAGTIGGRMAANVPGTDAKDFRSAIETLRSQQFLTGVQTLKGMGALSDAEGKKIDSAVANVDADQSQKQLRENFGIVKTTLEKARARLVSSGQLPAAGGAFVMTHPQYGQVSEGRINALMAQNPGSTREQVVQFLRSTGGK